MKSRFIGVVAALAAITIVFTAIVLTIAAIQDYDANRGKSFIERAASIVGIGSLTQSNEPTIVKIEISEDDSERYAKPSEPTDKLRPFRKQDANEGWSDRFFQRDGQERDYKYEFEDRFGKYPPEAPFDRWRFEGFIPPDWLDDLVERGFMTEEDADELRSLFDDLPEEFDERLPGFLDDRDFEFDSDDGRFRFRWRWDSSDDDWFFEKDPDYDKKPKNGI